FLSSSVANFVENLHSHVKSFQSNCISTKSNISLTFLIYCIPVCTFFFYGKCKIAITKVSSFSGNTGELIKSTDRCCQPQVSAYWIISQGRYSRVPKTSKGTLLC
ncbi:unnamed protein product, partial [Bubo scandiacus]